MSTKKEYQKRVPHNCPRPTVLWLDPNLLTWGHRLFAVSPYKSVEQLPSQILEYQALSYYCALVWGPDY